MAVTKAESKTSIRESWRQRIGGEELALAVITYAAGMILVLAVFSSIPGGALDPGTLLLLRGSASAVAALVGVGLCLRVSGTVTTWRSIGLRRVPARWYVFGVLGGLLLPVLAVAIAGAYTIIVGEAPTEGGTPSPRFADNGVLYAVLLLVIGGVVVPIAEELLFRGVIYTFLRRWGAVLAVIVSTIVFVIPHGAFSVLYLAVGLIFAVLYERSGSLLPGMLAHAVNNIIALSLLLSVA